MKELFNRLRSPSPKLFVKLQNVGIIIGGIGAAIVAFPLALPAAIVAAGGYMVAIGSAVYGIAKLPVKDTTDLDK